MKKSPKETSDFDPVLEEVIERLVTAYQPDKIYLFGSRARGTARFESDYDVLLVMNDNAPKELQSARKAYEVLWGITVPIDILVWTKTAFDERLHIKTSLPAEVVRQGKLLHVA